MNAAEPLTTVVSDDPPLSMEEVKALLPEHLRKFDLGVRDCWIFRSRGSSGYATNTSVKGRKGNAYRLIWEIVNGRQLKGGFAEVLDHLCDNGSGGCVNPYHLQVTTQRENTLRSRSETMPTSEELADIIGDVVGTDTPEGQKLLAVVVEVERLRAYADGETDKLRDALRKLDEQTLPPQRAVLHLYRAEEDGLIHFGSQSGNHVAMTGKRWSELGEPDSITIGVWAGVIA